MFNKSHWSSSEHKLSHGRLPLADLFSDNSATIYPQIVKITSIESVVQVVSDARVLLSTYVAMILCLCTAYKLIQSVI